MSLKCRSGLKLNPDSCKLPLGDHSLIYVYRKLSVGLCNSRHSTVTYREFKNFNSVLFRNDISSQDWNSISQLNDPNTMWYVWNNMFLNVADKHAPIRTKRVGTLTPWLTPHLKQCMHKRDASKITAIRSNDPADWHAFKRCRNDVNNQIKLAKENYYKKAFDECVGDPNKTWGVTNKLTSRKSKSSFVKEIKLEDVTVTNSPGLANAFNNHFITIGQKLAEEIPSNINNCSPLHYLSGHLHDLESF